eukprot:369369_1
MSAEIELLENNGRATNLVIDENSNVDPEFKSRISTCLSFFLRDDSPFYENNNIGLSEKCKIFQPISEVNELQQLIDNLKPKYTDECLKFLQLCSSQWEAIIAISNIMKSYSCYINAEKEEDENEDDNEDAFWKTFHEVYESRNVDDNKFKQHNETMQKFPHQFSLAQVIRNEIKITCNYQNNCPCITNIQKYKHKTLNKIHNFLFHDFKLVNEEAIDDNTNEHEQLMQVYDSTSDANIDENKNTIEYKHENEDNNESDNKRWQDIHHVLQSWLDNRAEQSNGFFTLSDNITQFDEIEKWLKNRSGLEESVKCCTKLCANKKKDSVEAIEAPIPIFDWNCNDFAKWSGKFIDFTPFTCLIYKYRLNGKTFLQPKRKLLEDILKCADFPGKDDKGKNDKLIHLFIYELEKCVVENIIMCSYYDNMNRLDNLDDIHKILAQLRPSIKEGPKSLWKTDAFYFAKIDNFLALFTATKPQKELVSQYYPGYLCDNKEENNPKLQYHHYEIVEISKNNYHKFARPLLAKIKTKSKCISDGDDEEQKHESDSEPNDNEDKENKKELEPKVFLWMTGLVFVALIFGFIVPWAYMKTRAINQAKTLMNWNVKSIGARAKVELEYEFFIPQMILNLATYGLNTGDITINSNDYITNGQFDAFFVQFQRFELSKHEIAALYMYENRTNTMIGGYAWNETRIFVFNNGMAHDYIFDETTNQRDENSRNESFVYDPTQRPWYKKAKSMNFGDYKWTEPYIFRLGDVGMTLVQRIMFNEVEIMFLVEFTVATLPHIFDSIVSPTGGITFLITPSGSVIASDTNETDLLCCPNSIATNGLLYKSIQIIRDEYNLSAFFNGSEIHKQGLVMILDSLKTSYFSNQTEYATIAIVYDDAFYLSKISKAEIYVISLFAASVIFLIVAIVLVLRYNYNLNNVNIPCQKQLCVCCKYIWSSNTSSKKRKNKLYEKISISDVNELENECSEVNHEHKSELNMKQIDNMIKWIVPKCHFWILIYFAAIFVIWTRNIDSTLDVLTESYFNEEYMIIQDNTAQEILMKAQAISDIIQDKFNRHDLPNTDNSTFPVEMDIFFANILESMRPPNGNFSVYAIYFATPDGKMIGSQIEKNTSTSSKYHNKLRTWLKDESTHHIFYQYITDQHTLKRNISRVVGESEYDPRCRPWYIQAIREMFNGSISDAFGDLITFVQWYNTDSDIRKSVACEQHIHDYLKLWNITEEDIPINNTDITQDEVTKIFSLPNIKYKEIEYKLVWSDYVFAFEGVTGLTATKPIVNKTTGTVIGVFAVDFLLSDVSTFLNSTSYQSWIFDGNKYDMVASSNREVFKSIDADECLQIAGTSVDCVDGDNVFAHNVIQHPNDNIRIISQEIINFYLNDDKSLPVNDTFGRHIDLPLDQVDTLSGRLLSYSNSMLNNTNIINWIVVKVIDINAFESNEHDDTKILGFMLASVLCLVFLVRRKCRAYFEEQKQKETDDETTTVYVFNLTPIEDLIDKIKAKLQQQGLEDALQEKKDIDPINIQRSTHIVSAKIVFKYSSAANILIEQWHDKSIELVEEHKTTSLSTTNQTLQCELESGYIKYMVELRSVIDKAATVKWKKLIQNEQGYVKGDYYQNLPLQTIHARNFMAKISNDHIRSAEYEEPALLKEIMIEEDIDEKINKCSNCPWKIINEWKLEFHNQRNNKWVICEWNQFIILVMCLHLVFTIYLPETPDILRNDGFVKKTSLFAIIAIPILISIEFIDAVLQICARYIEFKTLYTNGNGKNGGILETWTRLKHGEDHPILKELQNDLKKTHNSYMYACLHYFTSRRILIAQFILVILMIIDIIFTAMRKPFIGYWIPLVAISLILRPDNTRSFAKQFFLAVFKAKAVVFMFFVLVLIVSILSSAAFADILNPDSTTDSFQSSIRALITAFVFVSAGENYNEIVYAALGENEDDFWLNVVSSDKGNKVDHNTVAFFNLVFFATISVIGLFFFMPVIIHVFENSFDYSG